MFLCPKKQCRKLKKIHLPWQKELCFMSLCPEGKGQLLNIFLSLYLSLAKGCVRFNRELQTWKTELSLKATKGRILYW